MEKFKDFLYDVIDYVLVIVIIVLVAGIITWRLDILFAEDLDKLSADLSSETQSTETNESLVLNNDNDSKDENEKSENEDTNNDESEDIVESDKEENTSSEPIDEPNDNPPKKVQTIIVEIPQGSLGPAIADILIQKGLINNKAEFLKVARELNLDRKLKAGTYKIKDNSSLETIIKIIAGVK
ncbi:endolytic transglycosylase MltG [Thermohalobacter berrensis]|uniref:Aminodeoxychorismate lyase n=1 Tax=Thermohalobacter berrensis TaxID=99594 RepID=A0A419T279_9FIRM|nr:endolytic transglycosylase MltG [Thermohalobacter berrensis]RKD31552.1 hypothetical protein BET03_12345 [Thermohalobacter berrensis]